MLKKTLRTTFCGLFVVVAVFAQTLSGLVEQVAKIVAADGAADDRFGFSVSVSGDTAIVGAHFDDDAGSNSGSAYVFQRHHGGPDTWGQVAKITAADAAAGDEFGYTVSVSGDTAIVGARYDDDAGIDSGSAYVFGRHHGGPDIWGQVAKINAADAAAADSFGISVSVSGDIAIVGAHFDDDAGGVSGSAYVFGRHHGGPDTWGQVSKLNAADAAASDYFGISVSVSGDTAIVGAYLDDDAGSGSGSTYVFGRHQGGTDTWGQVAKINAGDAAAGDQFGYSVSVSGDTAIVGARHDTDGGIDSGSAYIFRRHQGGADIWGEVAKLNAADAGASDLFGSIVSVSGGTAIVGAFRGDGVGTAYVFGRSQGGPDTWGQVSKLNAADPAASDQFGYSVSVSGDTAIVGVRLDDDADTDSGSAYVFRTIGPVLTIPTAIPALSSTPIDVPVDLTTNAAALASLAFSVDYDATCLSFDPTDTNADGIPDAVDIPLPSSFSAIVFHDLGDTDGEIDVALFADDPTTTTFSDGTVATLTFTTTCSSQPTVPVLTPVVFSLDPSPDFSDPDAQVVLGSSTGGSVEIFSGVRGDCSADGDVRISDLTAFQLESFDGDGNFWADTLDVVPYLGSPVGCDANADTLVDAGDISCIARLLFGLTCGGARGGASEGPRLSLPGELDVEEGGVVVAVLFEPRGAADNSVIFSLDYDETRLVFDDVPGAVRFPGTSVSLESWSFDVSDTDGELDVVVADFSTVVVLGEGVLVEVDLRVLEVEAGTIENGVVFSAELPTSFGDVLGRSVPGTSEVGAGGGELFVDGFESGDTSGWSGEVP